MYSPGMSRPFGIGAVAVQGVSRGWCSRAACSSSRSHVTSCPGPSGVLTAVVTLSSAVHLLAVAGVVGMCRARHD